MSDQRSCSVSLGSREECRQLPAPVRESLRPRSVIPIKGGGSPAQLYAVLTDREESIIVKILETGSQRVDGHDIRAFDLKLSQIDKIRREAPGLSEHYLPTLGRWSGRTCAAFAMPFFSGESL